MIRITNIGLDLYSIQPLYFFCFDMHYALLVLQHAFYQQEPLMQYRQAVFSIQVRCDDHIGDAAFVFHAEEDESMGRSRPLSRDYRAGIADAVAIGKACQVRSAQDT